VRPELFRVGAGRHPVVVIDDCGDSTEAVAIASAMAPFPEAANHYPGLRRIVRREDEAANFYVRATLEQAAPFIAGGFDVDAFELIEASFSIVTVPPAALSPAQRAPHFDSTNPDYLAVLHYLSGTERAGTAFYRQRSTGIEAVSEGNLSRFVAAQRRESRQFAGYVSGSNEVVEQILAIEGVPGRLIVYRGCMLHSGLIPPDLSFDPDPQRGRLTANFFVRCRRH
jgi:hypothetical protein